MPPTTWGFSDNHATRGWLVSPKSPAWSMRSLLLASAAGAPGTKRIGDEQLQAVRGLGALPLPEAVPSGRPRGIAASMGIRVAWSQRRLTRGGDRLTRHPMPQGRGYLRFGDWHPGPSPNRKFMIPTTKEQSHEQRTQRGSIRPPSARLTEAFTQRSSTTPGRVPATVARRAQTLETASRASVFTAPAYKRTTGSNARPTAWEACKVPALSVLRGIL